MGGIEYVKKEEYTAMKAELTEVKSEAAELAADLRVTLAWQKMARAEIERLRAAHEEIIRIKDCTLGPRGGIRPLEGQEDFDRGCRMAFYRCAEISRQVLSHEQHTYRSANIGPQPGEAGSDEQIDKVS